MHFKAGPWKIHKEKHQDKIVEKTKTNNNVQDLWDDTQCSKIIVTAVLGRKEKENGGKIGKKIFRR